jgi:hypothetical protein
MTATRHAAAGTPKSAQRTEAPSARRGRRWRRLPAIVAIAIGAALLLPSAAAFAAVRVTTPTPAVATTAVAKCTRTVKGFTAAHVDTARNRAGRNGIVCFPRGTYTGNLHANVAGQTWRLASGARLTGQVFITAARVKLVGGTIARADNNRWIASVDIRANDVTVQSVKFRGGGTGINVLGHDRARIIGNNFRYLTGSAISIWSEGVGADKTLIYKNAISQSATNQVSPITSRGNESGSRGGVQNLGTSIRYNWINQGVGNVGWFGIELKQSKGALIEHNTIKGGTVLVSLPESDNATIRYNTFDLRGTPHWGVEVANAYNVVIDRNTFVGDGPTGVDYAITLNSGSLRTYARYNKAIRLRTFFAIAGDGHRVTDNCYTSIAHIQEFALNGGSNIVFARNRRC